MKEIVGKYNTAKVFTSVLDDFSQEQIKTLCDQSFIQGAKIRIMPDVHAGAGCTIGTTMTIQDKIVPNLVGVDIGCGMATYELADKSIDLEALDKFIHEHIPSSTNVRENIHPFVEQVAIGELRCFGQINKHRAVHSMGTLGGGNHFIEVDKDENGTLYLVVHSGSRYLGLQVAEWYQQEGYNTLNQCSKKQLEDLIEQLKAEGRAKEIQSTIKSRQSQIITKIDKKLAYVEKDLFDDYIHDMKTVQQYAVLNRKAMAEDIIKGLGLTINDQFTTIHNYIDTDAMILRKGAVSAKSGEKLLIPINMRDGSLICLGKGNEDWNCSAPHGAGRLFSRNQAKKRFDVAEFKQSMQGIYTTSISEDTLDECPMAYKTMDDIVSNIGPTADIVKVIKPIYNFKAPEMVYSKKR